eukprot:GGOE01018758.1.p1 GENE.GGOE01018758.1~~GGOE01018758.1.p1  ORF type:complete len:306 (+),score=65.43 GGOE01018758.1:36-920(+)
MADDLSAEQKLSMSLEEIIAFRQRHGAGESDAPPRRTQPPRQNLQRLQAQHQQRQMFQRQQQDQQQAIALLQNRMSLQQPMLAGRNQPFMPAAPRNLALAGQPQVVHVPVYVPVPVPASMAAGLSGLTNSSSSIAGGGALGTAALSGFRGGATLDSPMLQPAVPLTHAQQGLDASQGPFTMSGTGFRVDSNGQFVSNYKGEEPMVFAGSRGAVPATAAGRAGRAGEVQRASVTALPSYEDQAAARRQQFAEQQNAQRQQRRAAGVAAARANPAELEALKARGELTLSDRFSLMS